MTNIDFICSVVILIIFLFFYSIDSYQTSSLQKEAYDGRPKLLLKELKKLRSELDKREKENQENARYIKELKERMSYIQKRDLHTQ